MSTQLENGRVKKGCCCYLQVTHQAKCDAYMRENKYKFAMSTSAQIIRKMFLTIYKLRFFNNLSKMGKDLVLNFPETLCDKFKKKDGGLGLKTQKVPSNSVIQYSCKLMLLIQFRNPVFVQTICMGIFHIQLYLLLNVLYTVIGGRSNRSSSGSQ